MDQMHHKSRKNTIILNSIIIKEYQGDIMKLNELKWSGDIKTKKHPPEGLFAEGGAGAIVKWLNSSHSDKKSAISALNFYINRAGKNLSDERKNVLKDALQSLEDSK